MLYFNTREASYASKDSQFGKLDCVAERADASAGSIKRMRERNS
jgi:hypothetical protein